MSGLADKLLTAALHIASRGLPVFVLGRTKRPLANCDACRDTDPATHDPDACECLTCHGFYAATTDHTRLTAMITTNPGGLLALRTGAVSGLLVVDVDPGHGGRVDPDLMTPTVAVGTGNYGWHLYYRHPGHPVTSRPLPGVDGVDIKADGGYVVLPPSVHPDTRRPYRWLAGCNQVSQMPPALQHAVDAPPIPRPRHETAGITTSGGPVPQAGTEPGRITDPDALLDALLTTVRGAPKGRRRATLYGAARGVARIVAADALDRATAVAVLTDAGHAAQQSERDIRKAITGGFRDERVPL
ncbi:hypothetical protein JOF56_002784 [Kibdelosporangium banguiense]|uniref:DNA primase/polymerase bifunctional N-terminal domain-containing protein n=1 Tax=Kibdelosporangium banguiense TaxID=1365924 RepID=A0ABS4TDG9_9PSEU|nr:bifunctional DNA primase/polymerase [Kibdelosporangium banguiense]MBP2322399.1 hypothetical protein [Kibdelosporangium banguiense]